MIPESEDPAKVREAILKRLCAQLAADALARDQRAIEAAVAKLTPKMSDPETERAIQWLVWSALVDPAAGPHPAFPHQQEVAR